MRNVAQALLTKHVPAGDPMSSCSRADQKHEKSSVFLNAGLSGAGDLNTYGWMYNLLITLSPEERILWVEFQNHLEQWYASRLL
jgi:hypothetical protein